MTDAARGAGLLALLFGAASLVAAAGTSGGTPGTATQARAIRALFDEVRCPCGCGNYLPESSNQPACFGCSVGRAELEYIAEGLAAGRTPKQLLLELARPVLVNVFADYTDPGLPETWTRAKRVATELHQHRVVLRAPARSPEARRAVALAECARGSGVFFRVREALIRHSGPWDDTALLELASAAGLELDGLESCLDTRDLAAQIAKDRAHAAEGGIASLPAVSVNRAVVPNTDTAIRRAIQQAMLENSI